MNTFSHAFNLIIFIPTSSSVIRLRRSSVLNYDIVIIFGMLFVDGAQRSGHLEWGEKRGRKREREKENNVT